MQPRLPGGRLTFHQHALSDTHVFVPEWSRPANPPRNQPWPARVPQSSQRAELLTKLPGILTHTHTHTLRPVSAAASLLSPPCAAERHPLRVRARPRFLHRTLLSFAPPIPPLAHPCLSTSAGRVGPCTSPGPSPFPLVPGRLRVRGGIAQDREVG